MPLNHTKPHHGDSVAYGASALPWVTSSVAGTDPQRWDFPKVTKYVTVRNTHSASAIAIGFTHAGVLGTNRFVIPAGESETFDLRIRDLWVVADSGSPEYSLLAGLTVIDRSDFPVLTGSIFDVSSALPGENWQGVG